MAAISTAFLLLSKDDHVVITEDVYGGTFRMVSQVLVRFGISHTFVDMTDLEAVKARFNQTQSYFMLKHHQIQP